MASQYSGGLIPQRLPVQEAQCGKHTLKGICDSTDSCEAVSVERLYVHNTTMLPNVCRSWPLSGGRNINIEEVACDAWVGRGEGCSPWAGD